MGAALLCLPGARVTALCEAPAELARPAAEPAAVLCSALFALWEV